MVTQIPKSRTGKNGLNFSTRKLAESGKLAFYRRSPEFKMGNLSLGGTFQNLTVPRDPMCMVERAYILEGYKCGVGALPMAKAHHTVPPISNVQCFGMIATEILPVWSGRHKSSAAPSLLFPLTTVAPHVAGIQPARITSYSSLDKEGLIMSWRRTVVMSTASLPLPCRLLGNRRMATVTPNSLLQLQGSPFFSGEVHLPHPPTGYSSSDTVSPWTASPWPFIGYSRPNSDSRSQPSILSRELLPRPDESPWPQDRCTMSSTRVSLCPGAPLQILCGWERGATRACCTMCLGATGL